MSDWTGGYIAEVGYTYGYYAELNPQRLPLALLEAGLCLPQGSTACELGFGQGVSVSVHAAASNGLWYGTDFNPSQAALAQSLAHASGAPAQLSDESFEAFAQRQDLPDFDFIGLHGIWSWISDANRLVIVDFIRRKLKVGGVVYVSYNTLPGWAPYLPLRHLLTEHAAVLGAPGAGIVPRVSHAIDFAERLMALNPAYAKAAPQAPDRLKKIKDSNRNYLAHEYFNQDWHPMHFSSMAKWLEPAKLTYACSADYLSLNVINLTAEQQAFLAEIPDAVLRETVRDYMTNAQFRKDYWIKGPQRLNPLERLERLRALCVVLTTHRPDVPMKVAGALGEAGLSEAVYAPLLDLLADHQPRLVADLEGSLVVKGVSLAQLIQACMLLLGAGHLQLVQAPAAQAAARLRTQRLNAHLLQLARGSGDINYLASPVTGGAMTLGRFQQLFLLARTQGLQQPEQWARFVWDTLSMQSQKLVKDGRTLETAEENLAELNDQAVEFERKLLPIAVALGLTEA